ncbi:hypothetical protein [Sphingomonas taxi]|uniref:hypothetical protein n=1 Tax=Sphingomonas taxi TaxID=1549858 RepID=UPI0012E0BF59|nr:hypothetical protein [Sphingomonas taxi]
MLSPVAGVPTLTLIAEAAGWQAAFWTIVAITLVCIGLIATGLPASPPDALRSLIARVSLLPGKRRGEMNATLHGEFGAILAWVEARQQAENDETPGAALTGVSRRKLDRSRHSTLPRMSVTVVAGTCSHFDLLRRARW